MKFLKSLSLGSILFTTFYCFSQSVGPVTFSYALSKTGYKAGDTLDFIINAKISDGWCLYSSEFAADGPIKFNCILKKNSNYTQIGSLTAYQPFAHYDAVWEGEVKLFENLAQFRIPLVVNKTGKVIFKADIEGQGCNEVCVPISTSINLDLNTLAQGGLIAVDASVYKHYETHAK